MQVDKKQVLVRGLSLVFLAAVLGGAGSALMQSDVAAGSAPTVKSGQLLIEYKLPPDKLQKSYALYLIDSTLYLVTTAYGLLVLCIMLRTRFGAGLRDLAQRASRFRIVQAAIVFSLFMLVTELLNLPIGIYRHHVSLAYGLSVQQWGSWFGDWGKGLVLGAIFSSFVGWVLYAVVRRSPRRWWFYFWLATIPIVLFVIFVAPVVVDPLFNKFEPLTAHHGDLVEQIERVVHRADMNIPPERMFEMKASEKTTQLNAYVTGFGATKRVVVWDTTMQHLTIPQTLFVFGHEMGHYVLKHIPKMLTIYLLEFLVLFYLGYRIANWAAARYGKRWGTCELGDWASLPLLVLILSGLSFLATPLFNGESRYFEHQADTYGLEITHGLFPDSGKTAAESFQILGERSLDYPYVGKFAEFWLWNHPTIRDRVLYSQTYDPWFEGKQPQFVK